MFGQAVCVLQKNQCGQLRSECFVAIEFQSSHRPWKKSAFVVSGYSFGIAEFKTWNKLFGWHAFGEHDCAL